MKKLIIFAALLVLIPAGAMAAGMGCMMSQSCSPAGAMNCMKGAVNCPMMEQCQQVPMNTDVTLSDVASQSSVQTPAGKYACMMMKTATSGCMTSTGQCIMENSSCSVARNCMTGEGSPGSQVYTQANGYTKSLPVGF